MNDVLAANGAGSNEVKNKLVANGEHAEWFWRKEFQEAIEWLLGEESMGLTTKTQNASPPLFPNPSSDLIYVEIPQYDSLNLLIYIIQGSLVKKVVWTKGKAISISELSPGLYFLQNSSLNLQIAFSVVE